MKKNSYLVLTLMSALISLLFSAKAFAANQFYSIVGIGFADTEIDDTSSSGFSYRFAGGYEFHPKWQAEIGYQRFVDDESDNFEEGISTQAVTLSILGKAKNRKGELFYRFGVAYIDGSGAIQPSDSGACEVGTQVSVASVGTLCEFDEGFVGGVVGLGFDFYVGLHSAVRLETEYLIGDNQFSAATAYVSYKYSF